MIGWFVAWLQRLVQLGVDLAVALVAGLLAAPVRAVGRTGPIALRRGRPSEVIDVRHTTLRPGMPRETAIFAGDDAPDTRHWVAVQADRVVGVVTVVRAPMPEPPPGAGTPAWQLRGMAVLAELRGEHLGERLLLATHTEVGEPLWCNARVAVVPFYQKYGWVPVGPVFDLPTVGLHQRMWRG